jgi:hypothetical protein
MRLKHFLSGLLLVLSLPHLSAQSSLSITKEELTKIYNDTVPYSLQLGLLLTEQSKLILTLKQQQVTLTNDYSNLKILWKNLQVQQEAWYQENQQLRARIKSFISESSDLVKELADSRDEATGWRNVAYVVFACWISYAVIEKIGDFVGWW